MTLNFRYWYGSLASLVATMPTYRFYWFGGDGHRKGAENVECANDADAFLVAKQRVGAFRAVEVWLRTRLRRTNNKRDGHRDEVVVKAREIPEPEDASER